jgi:hypothetical protein
MAEFNDELFLAPKTTQYGSHMVMTNVKKPTKTKYINIDTKYRDEYNYLQVTDYNITLPERISDVKTMTVTSMEIPITFCNISSSLGNNSFQIIFIDNNNNKTIFLIVVPDGQYDSNSLADAINNEILKNNNNNNNNDPNPSDLFFTVLDNYKSQVYSNGATFQIDFTVNDQGIPDKYNFRYKLGWLLGFRNPYYTVNGGIVEGGTGEYGQQLYTSEQYIDLTGPRYLYLALEEFNKGNQKSFVSPIASSFINKNILARISLDNATHGYASVLPVNKMNGLLISDYRSYTGKIDLLKLNIKLLSENGNIISLNGYDFSFCLEVEHE